MIVETDFVDHWKTQMLRDALGGEIAVSAVLRLWSHCQQRKAWQFNLTAQSLKAICRFPGDPDLLLKSMVSAGFLDEEESGQRYYVHHWDHTNAQLVQAWQNGAKGGRPKSQPAKAPSKSSARDGDAETEAEPEPIRPGTGSISDRAEGLDKGDRLDECGAGERRAPPPTHQDESLYPPDSIPALVAKELNTKCRALAGKVTASAIANGPWLIDAYKVMPLDEWLRTAQEYAGNVNGSQVGRRGWLSEFEGFVRARHSSWKEEKTAKRRSW